MSKFKAVVTHTLPVALLDYLDSEEFATRLLDEVLGKNLHVADPTTHPAGHYVQELDRSIEVGGRQGIELTLSKISVMDGRSFKGALLAMQEAVTDAIVQFVPSGRSVDIFCVIATDIPVVGTNSTLYEMKSEHRIDGHA